MPSVSSGIRVHGEQRVPFRRNSRSCTTAQERACAPGLPLLTLGLSFEQRTVTGRSDGELRACLHWPPGAPRSRAPREVGSHGTAVPGLGRQHACRSPGGAPWQQGAAQSPTLQGRPEPAVVSRPERVLRAPWCPGPVGPSASPSRPVSGRTALAEVWAGRGDCSRACAHTHVHAHTHMRSLHWNVTQPRRGRQP